MQVDRNIAFNHFFSADRRSFQNPLLDPEQVPLDERSTTELINYLARLSTQFWYYDTDDKRQGDWSDFFHQDLSAILAVISESDMDYEFRRILDFLKGVKPGIPREQQKVFLWEVFDLCFACVFDINEWFITFSQYHVNHPFYTFLKELIWKKLSFKLRDIYTHYHALVRLDILDDKYKIDRLYKQFEKLHITWNFNAFPVGGKNKGLLTSEKELISFVKGLEEVVKDYFNLRKILIKRAGEEFGKSLDTGEMQPHIALLISFLDLYKHQQKSLNNLVPEHLRFYYEEILDFCPGLSQPDHCHVHLSLKDGFKSFKVPSFTRFLGGIDEKGKDIVFQSEKSLLAVNSNITDYLTLTKNKRAEELLFAPFKSGSEHEFRVPSIDEFTGQMTSFGMFGATEDQTVRATMAHMGWAIASPELALAGGERKVTISFGLSLDGDQKETDEKSWTETLTGAFDLALTGVEGWIYPGELSVSTQDHLLSVHFTISENQEAVVGYDQSIHGERYQTSEPIALLTLSESVQEDPKRDVFALLSSRLFEGYTIRTEVRGLPVKNIRNHEGNLFNEGLMTPFGSNPVVGAYLNVRNEEVAAKSLKEISLNIRWINVPTEAGFDEYYEAYNDYLRIYQPESTLFSRGVFQTQLKWIGMDGQVRSRPRYPLFGESSQEDITVVNSDDEPSSGADEPADGGTETVIETITPVEYRIKVPEREKIIRAEKKGLTAGLTLTLTDPAETFGNAVYPRVVAQVTMDNTRKATYEMGLIGLVLGFLKAILAVLEAIVEGVKKAWCFITGKEYKKKVKKPRFKATPGQPFTPQLNGISLSYRSEKIVALGKEGPDQFYLIHPQGIEPVSHRKSTLVPAYRESGYAFLGFDNLSPRKPLTLLLGIENRLDTHITEDFVPVKIEQLTTAGWRKSPLLEDSTFGLNKTGVISFMIHHEVCNDSLLMPEGKFWIRLSAPESVVNSCKLTMLGVNAVKLSRVMTREDRQKPVMSIPPGKIREMNIPSQQISAIQQPFPSAGGQLPENRPEFYQRVAQRLSTKDRAVSLNDFQSMILQRFTNIFRVNLLPAKYHNKKHCTQVTMSLVPVVGATDAIDKYRPIARADVLAEVLQSLRTKISPHVKLDVKHAGFEEVKIGLEVLFNDSSLNRELIEKLNQDLMAFMSPWIQPNELAYEEALVHTNDIIKFIRARPYVTNFRKFRIYLNNRLIYGQNVKKKGEQAEMSQQPLIPMNELNVLVSARQHDIRLIGEEDEDDMEADNSLEVAHEQVEESSPPEISSEEGEVNE